MKTHEIDTNVHAASSATGRAPEVKPPRSVPLPGASAGDPPTATSDPIAGPSLVVVPSPDPPGIEAENPVDSKRRFDGLG